MLPYACLKHAWNGNKLGSTAYGYTPVWDRQHPFTSGVFYRNQQTYGPNGDSLAVDLVPLSPAGALKRCV